MPVFRFPVNDLKKQPSEAGEGGSCKLKRKELGVCVCVRGLEWAVCCFSGLRCDVMLFTRWYRWLCWWSGRSSGYLSVRPDCSGGPREGGCWSAVLTRACLRKTAHGQDLTLHCIVTRQQVFLEIAEFWRFSTGSESKIQSLNPDFGAGCIKA